MFRQILIPLDGSQLAERTLPYIEQLAPLSGATIHLVSVVEAVPHPNWTPVPTYADARHYEAAESYARAYLEAVRTRLSANGVDVRTAQLTGSVTATLLDYERDTGIDLVVMCSHGRTGLARFALGSIASQLLRYGTVPVVLVRAFGKTVMPDQTLVPLDGSPQSEEVLRVVRQLRPAVMRKLTLLRVVESKQRLPEAEEYLKHVALRVQQDYVQPTYQVELGDPATQIVAATSSNTLVAMVTHGRAGVTRWVRGSVADRVMHDSAAAVLLMRR